MYVTSHVIVNPSTVHLLEPDSQLFSALAYGVIKLELAFLVTHTLQRGFSHRVPSIRVTVALVYDLLGLLLWHSIQVFIS